MKETIVSLEHRLLDAIESKRKELVTLNADREAGGTATYNGDREAKIDALKGPVFKGGRDAQEVENILWHLKNYFKCNKVKSDDTRINTAILYLSEMAMLWWKRHQHVGAIP